MLYLTHGGGLYCDPSDPSKEEEENIAWYHRLIHSHVLSDATTQLISSVKQIN